MNLGQVILTGVVLGLVCAAVVWLLERYQTEMIAQKFMEYLRSREEPAA